MRKYRAIAFAVLMGAALPPTHGLAQEADDDDDQPKLTRSSQNLPELILGTKDGTYDVNQKDFTLLAGQGYRWKITSGAAFEYKFHTDLFRDTWVNQIVIDDLEVHMNGAPAWLEFDRPGTIMVQFNTIRPGKYTWSVPDLVDKGMQGTITVK
ncbi:hypothetical protein M2281_005014 [Mesorhizobium soli]|uniref:hypothetical protein n=1 Tax=Pseudaminobacter soli (ex Li et al. 2025) TaxID=1295366 RepID=UPI002473B357|nr:hypothetical protein [Mesorhizobium soli]MDH6234396.1 hypothetical protein [Mesorhizobium soli]